VFGGGRMGLSHASMAGLLFPDLKIILIEPSFKTRLILNFVTGPGVKLKGSASRRDLETSNYAIIATPPKVHSENFKQLVDSGFKGRVLIEKPISVGAEMLSGIDVMSGYVLRHSYFWKVLLEELSGDEIVSARVQLETNQDFGAEADGWRVDQTVRGLSFLREFGSHTINLMLGLAPTQEFAIRHADTNSIELLSAENDKFQISLTANSLKVRKSVYRIEVETHKARYLSDFYSLTKEAKSGELIFEKTLAGEGIGAPAYLRGQEFSGQMSALLGTEKIPKTDVFSALKTDQILDDLEGELKCQN
jgi:predicted dehydrogenase